MNIKPFISAVEFAANVIILGSAAKAIYNKFSSSEDDGDEDQNDDDDNEDAEAQ